VNHPISGFRFDMTAAEIVRQIQTLDPKERRKVLDYLREMEGTREFNSVSDQVFDEAAERVMERHADLLRKLAE
jgi:hypothetical protein